MTKITVALTLVAFASLGVFILAVLALIGDIPAVDRHLLGKIDTAAYFARWIGLLSGFAACCLLVYQHHYWWSAMPGAITLFFFIQIFLTD